MDERDHSVSTSLLERLRSSPWAVEQVYVSGDEYFSAIEREIHAATKCIQVESYIFANDSLGQRITRSLCDAARRGVTVKVLVDGIGSPGWRQSLGLTCEQSGVLTRVYHEPFWEGLLGLQPPGERRRTVLGFLRRLNQRNHCKLFLFDTCRAYLGGMNIWEVHLASVAGDLAWRDTAVRIEGENVHLIEQVFEGHWEGRRKRGTRWARKIVQVRGWASGLRDLAATTIESTVLANATSQQRRAHYRQVLALIRAAESRLWITTPYFVPPRVLLLELKRAAARGVDVRLIVPSKSDVFFMPWASGPFYLSLLRAGAKVFEYQPRILHAKTTIGDGWALVGSSNMNHRSILHDLELDVLLFQSSSIDTLTQQFLEDQRQSVELTAKRYASRPWWRRVCSRIVLLFRVLL